MNLDNQEADALPVRKRRSRPAGRHRSPHSMTLPPEPPALVLGIPGAPGATTERLAAGIADEVALLTAGGEQRLEVRPAYVDGTWERLEATMTDIGESGPPEAPAAVLVPLLTSPHPHIETPLREVAAEARSAIAVAEPLGPHPLVAGVLHQRLAESGLARSDRPRLLSVSPSAEGIIVAASGGTPSVEAAETTSVLLASRLTVPAVPAVLDGSPGIGDAAAQLRDAGASRLAVAPCFIGPEADVRQLEDAAADIGAHCCAPLDAHPDIAKLVLLGYGTALDNALAQAEHAQPQE